MDLCMILRKVKPYMAMVLLQIGYSGMYIISLASLKHGMNHYVLVVYRNAVAVAIIAPFALCFERKMRPKMTLSNFLKIMALAFLEPVLDQNLCYVGTNYTSSGFATALYNILPAITFLLAIVFRVEKVTIKRRHSQAKVVGTLVTMAGALLMILYKGPVVQFFWSKGQGHHNGSLTQDQSNWIKGTFMLLGSCVCWSGFFMLQLNTLQSYPTELSLTLLICLMGTLLNTVVALAIEHKSGAKLWAIGFDTRLLTAVYSGVVCSGVAYYVQGIVMKERGPVFVTAFNPLCMIITAILGSIILAEEITLGRVIGAVIIVIGLYSLLWGKSKDHKKSSEAPEKNGALELPMVAKNTVMSSSTN